MVNNLNFPNIIVIAFEFLYGGQFTLSSQLIKPNYLILRKDGMGKKQWASIVTTNTCIGTRFKYDFWRIRLSLYMSTPEKPQSEQKGSCSPAFCFCDNSTLISDVQIYTCHIKFHCLRMQMSCVPCQYWVVQSLTCPFPTRSISGFNPGGRRESLFSSGSNRKENL